MKRFHVNVTVKNVEDSISFYNDLFDVEPTVRKENYAKWELTDPAVNFSITPGENGHGVNHLGIQFDSQGEVAKTIERLEKGKHSHFVQGDVECCYSTSNKVWSSDPQEVKWEHFVTTGKSDKFCDDDDIDGMLKKNKAEKKESCCS